MRSHEGHCIDGCHPVRVLDIQPESIHQRTPLVAGGTAEIEEFERLRDAG